MQLGAVSYWKFWEQHLRTCPGSPCGRDAVQGPGVLQACSAGACAWQVLYRVLASVGQLVCVCAFCVVSVGAVPFGEEGSQAPSAPFLPQQAHPTLLRFRKHLLFLSAHPWPPVANSALHAHRQPTHPGPELISRHCRFQIGRMATTMCA